MLKDRSFETELSPYDHGLADGSSSGFARAVQALRDFSERTDESDTKRRAAEWASRHLASLAPQPPVSDPEEAALTLEQRIANAGPVLTCFLHDGDGAELEFDASLLIVAIKESLDIVEDAERKGRALDAAEATEGER